MQTHAGGELRNSQNKRMRQDPYLNSGGRAPADMGGEPPDGRAKGQRASSQNRMFRGPLKRRRLRPYDLSDEVELLSDPDES